MIEHPCPEQRNHEVAVMQLNHRSMAYGMQSNGTPCGVCLTINSDRDYFSGSLHDADSILNPHMYVPFNDGLITTRLHPELVMYHQDISSFQHLGHFIKQGLVLQRTWDCTMQPESRHPNIPFKMHPQGNAQGTQLQDFHYFVVIDFEATCDMGTRITPQEIIEFPSVLVNGMTGRLEGYFQTYIKPVHHPVLTDFCKELTGIQQSQVAGGVSLSEALLMHDCWLEEKGVKNTNFAVVTWSDWDCKVMLESECNLKGIRKPSYFNRWINLKLPFSDTFGQLRCNLKGAVQLAGLTWEGRAHCGLDDAKNTARLLVDLMKRGIKLLITSSLSASEALRLQLPNPTRSKNIVNGMCWSSASVQGLGNGSLSNITDEDCYCGVRCNKCMVKKPGPQQGKVFFGCGKWSVTKGSVCGYFKWATTPELPLNA